MKYNFRVTKEGLTIKHVGIYQRRLFVFSVRLVLVLRGHSAVVKSSFI